MPSKVKSGWVYVLDSGIEAHRDDELKVYKIGRATDLPGRVRQFGTAYAYKPTIAYAFQSADYIRDEAMLHEKFSEKRLNGEWFKLDYADMESIALIAEYQGIIEQHNGTFAYDPFRPYDEQEALVKAQAYINNHPKYLTLSPDSSLSSDGYELEEDGFGDYSIEWEEEVRHRQAEDEERRLIEESGVMQ